MEAKEAQTVFNKVLIEQDKRKYICWQNSLHCICFHYNEYLIFQHSADILSTFDMFRKYVFCTNDNIKFAEK